MRSGKGLHFKTRLALWYLGIFVIFFLGLEIYSYYELRSVLFESLDAALAAEADRAAEDVDIGSGNLFAQSGDPPQAPVSAAAAAFSLRVVDASGAALGQRNGFPEIVPTLKPAVGFATVAAGGHDYRIVTRPIPSAAGGIYFIQAAHALDAIEGELASAVTRFLLILPLVLALAALGGIFLASAALRPVARLTRIAESVHGDRLALRSRYAGPDDEIGRLAHAFDGMLDRLEASFAREKRFTADASHELRTPLAALKGGVEVTLSRQRTAGEYEAALRGMKGEVDRLVSLSADLLLLARVGQAAIEPDPEGVDLRTLLDSCADGLSDQTARRGISLSRELEADVSVAGSRDILARLFMNLFENAVKYADEGGSIQVRSLASGDRAIVSIVNTGPGIAPAELAHVFEPFYRGDGARSRRSGGAGLGLAIAREIAEAHGGDISLSSGEDGETLALVHLPILDKRPR